MKSAFEVVNNTVNVRLQGSLYVEDAAGLREKFLEYINKGHNNFVLNLSEVDYIDSSGLGMLVAVQKRAVQNRGKVSIFGLKGTVKELFEMTRLDKIFDVLDKK
jgi:anti-sigma B factor antagonist